MFSYCMNCSRFLEYNYLLLSFNIIFERFKKYNGNSFMNCSHCNFHILHNNIFKFFNPNIKNTIIKTVPRPNIYFIYISVDITCTQLKETLFYFLVHIECIVIFNIILEKFKSHYGNSFISYINT